MTYSKDSYLDLLAHWQSSYSAADYICKTLTDAGFSEITVNPESTQGATPGGKYYLRLHETLVIAGITGLKGDKAAITACHTDVPGLTAKQGPCTYSDGMYRIQTEMYGGPILNSWFDSPLGISASVNYIKSDLLQQKTVCIDRPVGIIPNIAIHLNREVNNGVAIDKEKQMQVCIPINETPGSEKSDIIKHLLASELAIDSVDILSYEAFFFPIQNSTQIGDELIAVRGIDNSASASAILQALTQNTPTDHHQVGIFFDHEEIGSLTSQGGQTAASVYGLKALFNTDSDLEFFNILRKSFGISIDGAQGFHPLYPEKFDHSRAPRLGQGLTIKNNSRRGYATNAESSARLQFAFREYTFQQQYNHSNEKGGTTLGPLLQLQLHLDIVDMGIPMLAMHSTNELAHLKDIQDLHTITSQFLGKGC